MNENRVFVAWATTVEGERETVGVYRTEEEASKAAHAAMSEVDRTGDWGWDEATLDPFKVYRAWVELKGETIDLGVFADCERAVREAQDALSDYLFDRGWSAEEIAEVVDDDGGFVDSDSYWGVEETTLNL